MRHDKDMVDDSKKVQHPVGASLRAGLVGISLMGTSLILFLLEFSFRTFPALLPAGTYGAPIFDPDLNATVLSSPIIYNRARYVVRMANRDGFLDVDHQLAKSPRVIRVSFWGDSYVEAVQVPLEQTFWRQIPHEVSDREIETMAFGRSGWGTLNSLLAYRKHGNRYGVDIVIYLFVKNDAGDHFFDIQKMKWAGGWKPSAALTESEQGYEIHWQPNPDDSALASRLLRWMVDRSMLMKFVYMRTRLILSRWLDKGPNENDLPSTWPPDTLSRAKLLTRRVLTQMRNEVHSQGRHFAVLYVPRGTVELERRLQTEDTWYPWLAQVLADLNVPLIDPRPALLARAAAGEPVYDDHWTPAGHEAIATVLTNYLEGYVESEAAKHNGAGKGINLADNR